MYSCLLSFFLFSQKLHPKQTLAIFFFETLLKQVKCHRRKHAGEGIHKAKMIILQRQKPLCNRAGVYQIFDSLLFDVSKVNEAPAEISLKYLICQKSPNHCQ